MLSLSRPLSVLAAVLAVLLALLGAPPAAEAEQSESAARPIAAAAVTAATSHTCAVLAGGALRCWGEGSDGRLGLGSTADIGDDEPVTAAPPVPVGGPVVAVSAGGNHTCALLVGGTVRCWGAATDGRLGTMSAASIGDDEPAAASALVDLGGPVSAIAAGGRHTCALLADGSVRCWGAGERGQLGYGNTADVGDDETPASAGPVAIGGRAVAITAGGSHTCALLESRDLRCWGANASGRLGLGHTSDIGEDELPATVPTVAVGGPVVAVSAGSQHTCALLANGQVRCWGEAENGQLGYGNTSDIGDDEAPSTAGPVSLGGAAVAISTGTSHSCAALAIGGVRCWGWASFGQLGYGDTEEIGDDETPGSLSPVSLGGPVHVVTTGHTHTCAVLATAALRCWGSGSAGKLGLGHEDRVGDDEVPASVGAVPLGGSVRMVAEPPAAVEPRASTLTVTAKPRRDRRAPYRWRLRGEVTSIPAAAPCTGTVRITLRKGRAKVGGTTVPLGSDCTFRAKVRAKPKKVGRAPARLKVRVVYSGNESLLGTTRVVKVRAN